MWSPDPLELQVAKSATRTFVDEKGVGGWVSDDDCEALATAVLSRLQDLRIAKVSMGSAQAQALKPFADYADPTKILPAELVITNGSGMAKRQLTMGDCYKALEAIQAKQT